MMTFSSFLRCTVAVGALTAASAQAAQSGVYLLQLGSFEKKQAAQERWDALRGKYPNLLEGLSVRFMDVTLPPDNFTVYRTQAGALASRANAQSICDRLTAKGDECYVVETAMFKADDMNAPVPTTTPKADLSLSSLATQPAAVQSVASAAKVQVPAVPQPDAIKKPASIASDVVDASPPPLRPLSPTATPITPDVGTATARQQEVPTAIVQSEHRDTSTAMMQAAADTQQHAAIQPQAEEEGGFWSFMQSLDPFADDVKDVSPPAQKSSAKDIIETAPAATASVALNTPVADPFSPPSPPISVPQVPAPTAPMPSAEPQPLMGQVPPAQEPIQPVPVQVQQSPMQSAVPVGEPQLSYTLPPPPEQIGQAAEAFRGATPIPPTPSGSSAADVQVSEAVRVPLTQGQPQPEPTLQQERARLATPPMAMGTPSQQMPGSKTLWAQIGYFVNQQHALSYWDMFRKANPTFPPVRVRITSPYKAASSGAPKISLRVGPFDQRAYVSDICDEIISSTKDSEYPLDCRSVADINESVAPRMARATPEQTKRDSYFAAQAKPDTEMYWVQLGSFSTPAEADGYYRQLASAQKPVLDGLSPNIAPPIMGSSMEPIFRLRVGPYPLRHPADRICAGLQSRGSQCLIVFSK